jgi:L-threonylcarbamoyladenylate synthase
VQTLLTHSPEEAAGFIRSGGIVAFPTETVYGLGANVFDEGAIDRVFDAKMRPPDNPLIVHVANLAQINEIATDIPTHAQVLIDSFFPGPLTVVLRKADAVPRVVTAGLDTVGVRMPMLKLAKEFLSACGVPVAAPSANLSGRPSPTTWQAVLEDLNGRIDCLLQSEASDIGIESTVVDCTSDIPSLLRKGAISLDELRDVIPEIGFAVTSGKESPRSPGLKHKHYSPRAEVVMVAARGFFHSKDEDIGFIGLTKLRRAAAN